MPATYDQGGLKFQYPESWRVESQSGPLQSGPVHVLGQDHAVTLTSPSGAFWMALRCRGQRPQPLVETTLAAMRQEYPKLDAEPVEETVAEHRLQGYDLDFFCLDFLNAARIRGAALPEGALLVLYQAEDREMEELEPVFRAVTTSLLENLPVVKSSLWPPPDWFGLQG